mmetsp:Transcript_142707/g.443842  ORF Transcript_142707/g.443842 Transcript_142707/m.443842 type:complete len:515 (-) Transcript_142707:122-1666(-)
MDSIPPRLEALSQRPLAVALFCGRFISLFGCTGASYWNIVSGPCTLDGDCLQSPNFPANYGHSERCDVAATPSRDWDGMVIRADPSFWTEGCCDHLTVNGLQYNGPRAPDNVRPVGTITWSSNSGGNGGSQSWRLCPITAPSSTTGNSSRGDERKEEGPSFNMGPVAALSGGVLLVGCICSVVVIVVKKKKEEQAAASRAAVEQLAPAAPAGPEPTPTLVKPWPVVAAAPDASPSPTPDSAEEGRPSPTWIRASKAEVIVPVEETRVPTYWSAHNPPLGTMELKDASKEEQFAMQSLLDSTFKSITTRDRRTAIPTRLKLVKVQRVENADLWKNYASGRHMIRSKRAHRCTAVDNYGGEVATTGSLMGANKRSLDQRLNEVYLWHGTTPAAAMGISKSGFRLQYAGTKTGSMYGNGVYFAECSSKSDEYAADELDGLYRGLYCLLLCRVVLGELLHLPTGGEATHQTIKTAIESEVFDSVLGDRAASVGTYREFIVYQEDQVYPEYLVLYQRET